MDVGHNVKPFTSSEPFLAVRRVRTHPTTACLCPSQVEAYSDEISEMDGIDERDGPHIAREDIMLPVIARQRGYRPYADAGVQGYPSG